MKRILILGGGVGGTLTANLLVKKLRRQLKRNAVFIDIFCVFNRIKNDIHVELLYAQKVICQALPHHARIDAASKETV